MDQLRTKPKNLITLSEKNSYIAEQFRTIRANIKFVQEDKEFKTIVITSSIPGEGKSTNAANIAVVFAQEGKKVLLIDADLRKPTMHYTFRLENEFGLSNILSGLSKSNYGIQETLIDGLDILTSGPIPHNPAELLASNYLDTMLEEVRSNYHIIIFDTPPILAASDAQILAYKCDGTILIANIGYVKKWELEKTNASIHASKANLLGIILNNYKLAKSSYYYYE